MKLSLVCPDGRTATKRLVFLCLIATALSCPGANREDELRRFVAECAADPNIFIGNPPAELRLYADLSPEQAQKRLMDMLTNGTVLLLYPNGLPWKLESRKKHAPNGPKKSWYAPNADRVPRAILHSGVRPEIVWSPDSQIIALKNGGMFFSYFDTQSRRTETLPLSDKGGPSHAQLAAKKELDRKIRTLVEAHK